MNPIDYHSEPKRKYSNNDILMLLVVINWMTSERATTIKKLLIHL